MGECELRTEDSAQPDIVSLMEAGWGDKDTDRARGSRRDRFS